MSSNLRNAVYEATRIFLRQHQQQLGEAMDEASRQLAPILAGLVRARLDAEIQAHEAMMAERDGLREACRVALVVIQADLGTTPIGRDARLHAEALLVNALERRVPRG